jgi:hypothetical protein
VDAALYSQEMAFRGEMFNQPHPTDRVQDDLVERFAPHTPGTVIAAQLTDERTNEDVATLGRLLSLGWPLDAACARIDLPIERINRWRTPYPGGQDYTLELRDDSAVVTRDVEADAQAEPIVVQVDGVRHTLLAPEGPSTLELPLDVRPQRVVLDPARHLAQSSRLGEVRPAPLRWTLSGQISSINFSERFVSAFALITIRRASDTRNRWRIWAFTNQRDRLAGRLTYTRFVGPLIRGFTRAHAISLSANASWLNPSFSDLGDADYTLGGTLSYAWDTRVYSLAPMDGARVSVSASAGGAPTTGQTFVRLRGAAVLQKAATPRHVFAGRLNGGVAFTDIAARRLDFGGSTGIRGLPDALVQTDAQGVFSGEYRAVLARHMSVPLFGLGYLTEIQLTTGIDVGVGFTDDRVIWASGAAVSLGFIADILGMLPTAAHLTFGVPAWHQGLELPDNKLPFEIYLTWGQNF